MPCHGIQGRARGVLSWIIHSRSYVAAYTIIVWRKQTNLVLCSGEAFSVVELLSAYGGTTLKVDAKY